MGAAAPAAPEDGHARALRSCGFQVSLAPCREGLFSRTLSDAAGGVGGGGERGAAAGSSLPCALSLPLAACPEDGFAKPVYR